MKSHFQRSDGFDVSSQLRALTGRAKATEVMPESALRFWKLANAYPLMEHARGYLMALGLDDDEGAGDGS